MNIYIVMGTTGEYSDRSEWSVVAFKDKEMAKKHVTLATEQANEIYKTMIDGIYDFDALPINPYDPKMKMDYSGTSYFINETILVEDNLND
jgi:hypothetical protein